jgi:hypothetical protein
MARPKADVPFFMQLLREGSSKKPKKDNSM